MAKVQSVNAHCFASLQIVFSRRCREDRLIRVINAVLIVVRPLRRPRAGQPREWVVVPARAPIVPRVVVRISLVVTGVEHAVAVDVPVVVVVALPEGAGCGNGDCGD